MRHTIVLGALFFTLQCKSPGAFLEEHRQKSEIKWKAASAIAGKIKNTPPLSAEGVDLSGRPAPVFSKEYADDKTSGNVQIVDLWDLQNPGKSRSLVDAPIDASWFHDSIALLTTGRFPPDEYDAEGREFNEITPLISKNFKRLETMQYLLVIKVLSRSDPRLVAKSSFIPGQLKGEVHVYAVDDGTYLGGFPFEAKSDDKVSHSQSVLSNNEALKMNLWRSARLTILGAIKKYLHADAGEIWF